MDETLNRQEGKDPKYLDASQKISPAIQIEPRYRVKTSKFLVFPEFEFLNLAVLVVDLFSRLRIFKHDEFTKLKRVCKWSLYGMSLHFQVRRMMISENTRSRVDYLNYSPSFVYILHM